MIYFIVGHRGSGKTSFLNRIATYYKARQQNVATFDLDREIEIRTQMSVADIFAKNGEGDFRALEVRTLNELVNTHRDVGHAVYIALGAGCITEIPVGVEVIWLRRDTDAIGRIFIDRPRLNPQVDPLTEYQAIFAEREKRFARLYTRCFTVPEGWNQPNEWEAQVLGLRPAQTNYSVTLLPEVAQSPLRLEAFLQESLSLGARFIELRDDLLTERQIFSLLDELPEEKVLLSFRRPERSEALVRLHEAYATDWAIELGKPSFIPSIASVHRRQSATESIDQVSERLLACPAKHWKLAVEVKDFSELWVGHKFFDASPSKHSFLPCSTDGRWKWYRLLRGPSMFINFYRTGSGSAADQPLLLDVLRENQGAHEFAAVLGEPVLHSLTPAEHYSYFKKYNWPVVAIQMAEKECTALGINVLQKLGLRAAAITSPLKNTVIDYCQQVDKRAQELGAVNTIIYNPNVSGWVGTNTDIIGLEKIFNSLEIADAVAVWGGGGTRSSLRQLLPRAHYFSARFAEPLWVEDKQTPIEPPRTVVWAVPRARMDKCQMPPKNWQPECVLDLNYTEDSGGRAYALQTGAKYISGRGFFQAQAAAQREFWNRSYFSAAVQGEE